MESSYEVLLSQYDPCKVSAGLIKKEDPTSHVVSQTHVSPVPVISEPRTILLEPEDQTFEDDEMMDDSVS